MSQKNSNNAKKSCRKAGSLNIIRLARTLHSKSRGPFQCSHYFRTQQHDPEITKAEPLDEVHWNKKTKRYEMVQQGSNKFYLDDAILQAMVMLFVLARIQHGWKQAEACAQLTTWPHSANSGVKPQSNLPREWDEEIQQLIRTKKMGKKHQNSINNYNSFASIYCEDRCSRGWDCEARKDSRWAPFNEFSEHSVIQWALAARKEDVYISELAVVLLKYLFLPQLNAKERVAIAEAFYDILLTEGMRDEPTRFGKNALLVIENDMDLENIIESFQPNKFLTEHLPYCGRPNDKMKGIYRSNQARNDMNRMVLQGVEPE